jgi:hypothetical protein
MNKLYLLSLSLLSNFAMANRYIESDPDIEGTGSGLGGGIILLVILCAVFFLGDKGVKKGILSVLFQFGLVIAYLILCSKLAEAIAGSMTSALGIILFIIFYFVPLYFWWKSNESK